MKNEQRKNWINKTKKSKVKRKDDKKTGKKKKNDINSFISKVFWYKVLNYFKDTVLIWIPIKMSPFDNMYSLFVVLSFPCFENNESKYHYYIYFSLRVLNIIVCW